MINEHSAACHRRSPVPLSNLRSPAAAQLCSLSKKYTFSKKTQQKKVLVGGCFLFSSVQRQVEGGGETSLLFALQRQLLLQPVWVLVCSAPQLQPWAGSWAMLASSPGCKALLETRFCIRWPCPKLCPPHSDRVCFPGTVLLCPFPIFCLTCVCVGIDSKIPFKNLVGISCTDLQASQMPKSPKGGGKSYFIMWVLLLTFDYSNLGLPVNREKVCVSSSPGAVRNPVPCWCSAQPLGRGMTCRAAGRHAQALGDL